MNYLLVLTFALADISLSAAVIAETSTADLLATMVTAVITGGGASVLAGVLALRRHRAEQAKWREEQRQAEGRLDLDRFDKSMALLVAENERQYEEIGELRARAREDHELIIGLQDDLALAKREARTAFDSAAIANARIAELEQQLEVERNRPT